jgi:hypothetical protein
MKVSHLALLMNLELLSHLELLKMLVQVLMKVRDLQQVTVKLMAKTLLWVLLLPLRLLTKPSCCHF